MQNTEKKNTPAKTRPLSLLQPCMAIPDNYCFLWPCSYWSHPFNLQACLSHVEETTNVEVQFLRTGPWSRLASWSCMAETRPHPQDACNPNWSLNNCVANLCCNKPVQLKRWSMGGFPSPVADAASMVTGSSTKQSPCILAHQKGLPCIIMMLW